MEVKEQITMLELINKGILCFESVKAKMNGSCVASLDRFATKNSWCLQVEASEHYPGLFNELFSSMHLFFNEGLTLTSLTFRKLDIIMPHPGMYFKLYIHEFEIFFKIKASNPFLHRSGCFILNYLCFQNLNSVLKGTNMPF